MPDQARNLINIMVESEYLADQSDAEGNRWVFAYHVSITNAGDQPAKLLTRHWVITDGEERVQEVHGEGVIGEQPRIMPGQTYEYSSGAILETSVGSMHGSYQMTNEAGEQFDAEIAPFSLSEPYAIN